PPWVGWAGERDPGQMGFEPFLTGRNLEALAGDYPVWRSLPIRAQDVPGAIARAYLEAQAAKGPTLVIVPMGDWEEPADELAAATPRRVLRPQSVTPDQVTGLADLIAAADSPTFLVGPGADSRRGGAAVVARAERLPCPVWQESFTRRVGFPQDHPQFAGHLPN